MNDVLSGSWPGEIYLFRGRMDGKFAAVEAIKGKNNRRLKAGKASAAFAADWDADGDLDLVIGNLEGEIYLARNEGTSRQWAFAQPQRLPAAGGAVKVEGDAGPAVADWDGDGKPDLITGAGDGSVTWYRNAGSAKEPALAAGVTLVPASKEGAYPSNRSREGAPSPARGARTKICAADWNHDGRLDLLVGDFSAFEETPPEPKPDEQAAVEKAKREYAEAEKRYFKAYSESRLPELWREHGRLEEAPEDENPEAEKARLEKLEQIKAEIEKIEKQLEPLSKEFAALADKVPQSKYLYHGWVWLFERKPAAPVEIRKF